MPIYEYECERGHRWSLLRPVARRHEPPPCPVCQSCGALMPSVPLPPWIQGVSNVHQGWSKDIQDPMYEPDGEV